MRSTSSSPTDVESLGDDGRSAGVRVRSLPAWRGACSLSLYYLAFLFPLFLPGLLVMAPLQKPLGGVFPIAVTLAGLVVCTAWKASAARRIGSHAWPMAIAKGLAVVVPGMLIDTPMSVVAVGISLRLA